MFFHKKQKVTNYRPGDIVFFNFSGRSSAGHVGICELGRDLHHHH